MPLALRGSSGAAVEVWHPQGTPKAEESLI
jgi:hypothetical protein